MRNLLSRIWVCVTIRRGIDWILDLLTTHHSELQVITALSLISTLYKSSQYLLSFPACCVFNSRSLATASNTWESSASHAQLLPSPCLVQNCLPNISSAELDRHFAELSFTQHYRNSSLFLHSHSARTEQKASFQIIPQLLLAYSLPLKFVYRAVAYQWTSPLDPVFRPSGVMSQCLHNTRIWTQTLGILIHWKKSKPEFELEVFLLRKSNFCSTWLVLEFIHCRY
jgi:hypothetical protein